MGPRREHWQVPQPALKEALLNALQHRDYQDAGAPIMVELYCDRLLISNLGGLVPLVDSHFGQASYARNPSLFSLFQRMHLVERAGSGIGRIREAMTQAGLPEPTFTRNDLHYFAIALALRTIT